jgi:hypothetical protein
MSMECILGSGVPWLRPPSSSLVRGIKSSACRDKGDRREIWRTCGLEVCKRRALRVGNYEEGRMRRGCRLGSVAATEQERKVHAMRGRGRGRQRQGNHTSTTRSGHTHNAGVLLSYHGTVGAANFAMDGIQFGCSCSSLHLTHLGQLHSLLGACLLPFFCLWAPAGLWCHCVAIHQMMTTTVTFLCPW